MDEAEAERAVYGDWLLERGDERGELIQLELADRRGALADPDALQRMLELAARHGFRPDEPAPPPLAWQDDRDRLTERFDVIHDDVEYHLNFSGSRVRLDSSSPGMFTMGSHMASYEHDLAPHQATAAAIRCTLALFGEAIALGRLAHVQLPTYPAIVAHAERGVHRDHARWLDGWERHAQLRGSRLARNPVGPVWEDDD